MQRIILCFSILLVSLGCVSAQVTIELSLDQEQYLPGESLPVIVRITNRSGQTLTLGEDQDWLKFSVESRDVPVVVRNGEAPVVEQIILESAHAAIKRVNIEPYFNLKNGGHYTVSATVLIRDWGKQINSAPVAFDIIHAAILRELEFGVPLPPGESNRPPEVRKYSLFQANYLQKLMLYFQLSEASGKHNKVFPLGRMLNMNLQDTQLDRASNLHLLYQIGAHSSCYTEIDPDGNLLKRQTYEFTTHPRLKYDEKENIFVVGATRAERPDDLPKPDPTAKSQKPPP
jgi:hypothetical protein